MTRFAPNLTDTALIFEGGAMRASHGSGALVALLEAGVFPNWVGGISAGASQSLNFLTRDRWRARAAFTVFAADPRFGGLRSFARGDGYFNAQFIYEEAGQEDNVLPFNWEAFRTNATKARIGALNAETGETIYWGRSTMSTPEDLFVRVRASSTLPVMMPPIRVDGELYVDGALGRSGGIALEAAQADGYRKFLVVLSQPRDFIKHPGRQERLAAKAFHQYPAVAEALVKRPERYNTVRQELFDLESQGDAYLFVPDEADLVSGTERKVTRLTASHEAGKAQAEAEMPQIKEFLGLS
ncbi:patatin-like phospholipase family protein [Demetria terragena]|uniref:patatin-like phospholipase family protein n=1 Tax=Demetria terragena TaxID=63959 RepID=UPI000379E401|nr:patatin family protein [Demetria terragena]